jgi:hypothetical protein
MIAVCVGGGRLSLLFFDIIINNITDKTTCTIGNITGILTPLS